MPRIQKQVFTQDLAKYRVWLIDNSPSSNYFKIIEMPETLTGGKNAFLIVGTPNLVPTTEVKVEVIDSNGNAIYIQPIRNYLDGTARLVVMEVYEDTPPGPAQITILGELSSDINGGSVPSEWIGKYNVKWSKSLNISPFAVNSTKIRLKEIPEFDVSEVLVPFRQSQNIQFITASTSGIILRGISNVAGYSPTSVYNTKYIVSTNSPFFSQSMVDDGILTSVINGAPYSTSLEYIINDTTAIVKSPFTQSGVLSSFSNLSNFTMSYAPDPSYVVTQYTRSFANINISKLTTLSGDIARAKIFVRSTDQPGKYELLDDIKLESGDLISTQSFVTADQNIEYGKFINQSIINSYWTAGSASVAAGYIPTANVSMSYNSNVFLDSVHISNIAPSLYSASNISPRYYIGTATPIDFSTGLEFTFEASIVGQKSFKDQSANLDVYLSGSAFSISDRLGYKIASYTMDPSDTYKQFISQSVNVIIPTDGTAQLNFVINSGDWYIRDVHMKTSQETGFNPDFVKIASPITGRRYERLQFKTELYDNNNNLVPIVLETDPIYFDGGNYVLRGTDNRFAGRFIVAPSGSGPQLAVDDVGAYIGIINSDSTNPNPPLPKPIHSSDIPTYIGPSLITIYSGSAPYSGSHAGVSGIGIQGIYNSTNYFDFNTINGFSFQGPSIVFTTPTFYLNAADSRKGVIALGGPSASLMAYDSGAAGVYLEGQHTGRMRIGEPSASHMRWTGDTATPTTYTLYVSGGLAIDRYNTGTYIDVRDFVSQVTQSLSQSLAAQEALNSSSLAQTIIFNSSAFAAVDANLSAAIQQASGAYNPSYVTQSIIASSIVDTVNLLRFDDLTPRTGSGLILQKNVIGFYSHSASVPPYTARQFPVIISSSGDFRIADHRSWNGSGFNNIIGMVNGNFLIQNDKILIQTNGTSNGLQILGVSGSINNANVIRLGPVLTAVSAVTGGIGSGIYMDGAGNFFAGSGSLSSAAGSYISYTPNVAGNSILLIQSNFLNISSSGFQLLASGSNASANSTNILRMGPVLSGIASITGSQGSGFFVDGTGNFFVGSGSLANSGTGSFISFTPSSQTLQLRSTQFWLTASGLTINSDFSTPSVSARMMLGTASAYLVGNGIYMDGSGVLRVGDPAGANMRWTGPNFSPTNTLIISGGLAIINSAGTYQDVLSIINNSSQSLSSSVSSAQAFNSAALAQSIVLNSSSMASKYSLDSASFSQSIVFNSSSQAAQVLSISQSFAQSVTFNSSSMVSNISASKIVDSFNLLKLPDVSGKTGSGLILQKDVIGFYSYSSGTPPYTQRNFPVIISSSGDFRIAQHTSWNGSGFDNFIGFVNGTFAIQSNTILIRTNNTSSGLQIIGNNGNINSANAIRLGPVQGAITSLSSGSGAGVYMDGDGNFFVGSGSLNTVDPAYDGFDTFADTDNSGLGTHTPDYGVSWVTSGGGPFIYTAGGTVTRARGSATSSQGEAVFSSSVSIGLVQSARGIYYIQTNESTQTWGLMVYATQTVPSGSRYFGWYNGPAARWEIVRSLSGVNTVLGSFSEIPATQSYHDIVFSVSASNLVLSVDGIVKVTATNSSIAGGQPGIYFSTGTGIAVTLGSQIDKFYAYNGLYSPAAAPGSYIAYTPNTGNSGSALSIRSQFLNISSSGLFLQSSGSDNTAAILRLGNVNGGYGDITGSANDSGLLADGNGNFFVGNGSIANQTGAYIAFTPLLNTGALTIRSPFLNVSSSGLFLQSSGSNSSAAILRMGPILGTYGQITGAGAGGGSGVLMDGNGNFFVGSGSLPNGGTGSFISFTPSTKTLLIRSDQFYLTGSGIRIHSNFTTPSINSEITLGQAISYVQGNGVYMSGLGDFRVSNGVNALWWDSNNLSITASQFNLKSSTLQLNSNVSGGFISIGTAGYNSATGFNGKGLYGDGAGNVSFGYVSGSYIQFDSASGITIVSASILSKGNNAQFGNTQVNNLTINGLFTPSLLIGVDNPYGYNSNNNRTLTIQGKDLILKGPISDVSGSGSYQRAILGNYTVVSQSLGGSTSQSNHAVTLSGQTFANSNGSGQVYGNPASATISSAVVSANGLYLVTFQASASINASANRPWSYRSTVDVYAAANGGSLSFIESLEALSLTNSGTGGPDSLIDATSQPFSQSYSVPGASTQVDFQLVPGAYFSSPKVFFGTLRTDIQSSPAPRVQWTDTGSSVGVPGPVTFNRRGLKLSGLLSNSFATPQISFEPISVDMPSGNTVPGEIWYHSGSQEFQYNSNYVLRSVPIVQTSSSFNIISGGSEASGYNFTGMSVHIGPKEIWKIETFIIGQRISGTGYLKITTDVPGFGAPFLAYSLVEGNTTSSSAYSSYFSLLDGSAAGSYNQSYQGQFLQYAGTGSIKSTTIIMNTGSLWPIEMYLNGYTQAGGTATFNCTAVSYTATRLGFLK